MSLVVVWSTAGLFCFELPFVSKQTSHHVSVSYRWIMSEKPTTQPAAGDKPERARDDVENATASPSSATPDHASLGSHNNGDDNKSATSPSRSSKFQRAYDAIFYTPKRCRWDPVDPPKFSIWLNFLFGAAGAFTVANLYYTHPILGILADDFNVDYVAVAEIPTLAQAGYAVGLLTLCPLGDLLKRRPFVLYLVFFTASLS